MIGNIGAWIVKAFLLFLLLGAILNIASGNDLYGEPSGGGTGMTRREAEQDYRIGR